MRFDDFSPPPSPSLDQQRDALRKGLGRAMLWATTGRLGDEPLLAACLQDQRYDGQVEDSRGDWLWQMVRAVEAADRFRVPILHSLYELSDKSSANQLCELALRYAEMGDEAFRARLYEIVEQKPICDRPWLGDEEIIQLDGEAGFLFAAGVRGRSLAGRDWEWNDDGLIDSAIKRFGEERVVNLLAHQKDPALRSYREGWELDREAKARRKPGISHQERMRAIRVTEVLSASELGGSRLGLLRGWGMHAEDSELAIVFRHLLATREAKVIANLLRVFSNRSVPQFVEPLIELCQHSDTEVRRRAFVALEKIQHPLVREFALSRLEGGLREESVIGLLIRNFRSGDEPRILEAIEIPDDECDRHGLMMDVIRVLENNPDAESSRLALVAYASTPCENCRFDSARLLHDRQVAPGWLLEECRHDSSEECRGLVADIRRSPESDDSVDLR